MKKLFLAAMMMVMVFGASMNVNAAWNPLAIFQSEEDKFLDRQYDSFKDSLVEEGHEFKFSSTQWTTMISGERITSRYFSVDDKAYELIIEWKMYNKDICDLVELRVETCDGDEEFTVDEFVNYLS